MTPKRAIAIVAVLLAALWALQGGEYGTTDLIRQRSRRAGLRADVDSLGTVVDSLRAYKQALRTDATLQERIAREEFGMVRGDRELLYRFADSGSTAAGGNSGKAAPPEP